MFWLIIVPLLTIFVIFIISKFIVDHPSKRKDKNNDKDGNIYKQTIFRDDD